MADLLKLKQQVEEFRKEYFYRNRQAEENRQKENQAAVRIQSWFRACKVRAYLSHLHKKAIILQKTWRGFAARAYVRQMVKAAYFTMKMNFYNEMAVRIQRRWRGYYVRKYIHNFYARKNYLEQFLTKDELMRKELDEIEEAQKREKEYQAAVKEQKTKIYQAHQLHHLLSTKQCPGVFNSPFRQTPHEMELLLRQVKYQVPTSRAHRDTDFPKGIPDSVELSSPGFLESQRTKSTRSWDLRTRIPPIVTNEYKATNKKTMTDEADDYFKFKTYS
ncbi:spermatogenesis-associated protein 17 [Girardinichthys multiradiatus]|uniref:spermatogenesis-associated protein 17 n=1 Tax=Girardinichthys multiradiatus TaxID=208333 RepID=UPI001FABF7A9|nr:spermatogenesis-associated protein 17 [Girardinichthys multiradiatus]